VQDPLALGAATCTVRKVAPHLISGGREVVGGVRRVDRVLCGLDRGSYPSITPEDTDPKLLVPLHLLLLAKAVL
jgi:hypothetical protein